MSVQIVDWLLGLWQNATPAGYAQAVCCIVLVGWLIRRHSGD